MSYGKSWVGLILAKTQYHHNKDIRIGVANESMYNLLLKDIPAENLIKLWEKREEKPLEIIWDDYYETN